MILGNSAIGGTGLGDFNDPFYNYVTLLLTGANGSNATSNNTFIDNSQYSQPVTRNGDATQGSFTPYNGNYYSNFFDGSGDYLSAPSASNGFGTGDFTVEAWFFKTGSGTTVVSNQDGGSDVNYFVIDAVNANAVIQIRDGAGQAYAYGPAVVNNTWSHIAVTRASGSVRVFVNGIAGTPVTITKSVTSRLTIVGGFLYAGFEGYFTGYISNLRIIKGIALYTSNFTPPSTAPLTAVTGTSLLTCQNNRFIDNSLNNYTITRAGDTSVRAFNPFAFQGLPYAGSINGGSMYFDGSGDYLTVPGNSTFEFGTGNMTMEAYVYRTVSGTVDTILQYGRASVTNYDGISWSLYISSSNYATFEMSNGVSAAIITLTSSVLFPTNVWTYLALVRSGNNFTLYQNGVSVATGSTSSAFYIPSSSLFWVARNHDAGTGDMAGYISDVRIVKGTAVYTTAFTPPTTPLTAIANTSLLLRGTNAAIFDRKEINDIAAIGDTQLRTAITRYNSTSMFFDGTGDFLQVALTQPMQLAGDFTIEAWVYLTANPATDNGAYLTDFRVSSSNNFAFGFLGVSGATRMYGFVGSGPASATGSAVVSLNQWNYVAYVRSGSTVTLYLNGVSSGSFSSSFSQAATGLTIASRFTGATEYINGYIDDFRITNGVARYTTNFIPPTYSPLGF